MAAPPQLDVRIDLRLEALRAMLADLPGLIAEWPSLTEAERCAWSLDWDQLMGALEALLDPACRSGAMRGAQRECYLDLMARLRDALPNLRALDLATPLVPSGVNRRT